MFCGKSSLWLAVGQKKFYKNRLGLWPKNTNGISSPNFDTNMEEALYFPPARWYSVWSRVPSITKDKFCSWDWFELYY